MQPAHFSISANSTFIDLFLKVGDELPRYSHVLNTLEGMALVTDDLAARQHEFERIISSLTSTLADYQTLCDEITRLRDVYSQLQITMSPPVAKPPSHAA